MGKVSKLGAFVFVFVLLTIGCGHSNKKHGADALWHIVSQQCLEKGIYKEQKVNPCQHIDTEKGIKKGHAILKDQVGILQYLLLPTTNISGIESPKLRSSKFPNYFYLAWEARSFMELKLRGDDLNPENASLAVNSKYGRTQNHFHVHISCPKPSIYKQVKEQLEKITEEWALLPIKINGHNYYAKKSHPEELKNSNVFASMAQALPDAKKNMAEYGLGMLAFKSKASKDIDLVLLATRKEGSNKASVEEIQDHKCPQMFAL